MSLMNRKPNIKNERTNMNVFSVSQPVLTVLSKSKNVGNMKFPVHRIYCVGRTLLKPHPFNSRRNWSSRLVRTACVYLRSRPWIMFTVLRWDATSPAGIYNLSRKGWEGHGTYMIDTYVPSTR